MIRDQKPTGRREKIQMNSHDYEDIIHLPHYEPRNHPRMPIYKRAAQFAPFAALTGYDQKVEEAGRYVEGRPEQSEDDIRLIEEKNSNSHVGLREDAGGQHLSFYRR